MHEKSDGAAGPMRTAHGHGAEPATNNKPQLLQQPVPRHGGSALRSGVARVEGLVPEAGRADENAGPLSGGGQRASGAGRADGGAFGLGGSHLRADGPDFSVTVAQNGYAWWYVDAISDDGEYALTIIAFIGSVFSPYYKWARRSGPTEPLNHCAINVALYGRKHQRWTMTERSKRFVKRDKNTFEVGPSSMRWEDGALVIDIHEISAPLPRRVHGRVRLRPQGLFSESFNLDDAGRHRWGPIAPVAQVEVEMQHPDLRWSGQGYFDHNKGDEPLEDAFSSWDWSRAHAGSDTLIHYDALTKNGATRTLGLRFVPNGEIESIPSPPSQPLRKTLWRIDRNVRCEPGARPSVVKTLEDTPFYARSIVQTNLGGEELHGVHERLRLDRFCAPIVQGMLPFRMPRVS